MDTFIIVVETNTMTDRTPTPMLWVVRATEEEARRLADDRAARLGWRVKEIRKAPAVAVKRLRLAPGQMADYL
jgi:hypothetical protein